MGTQLKPLLLPDALVEPLISAPAPPLRRRLNYVIHQAGEAPEELGQCAALYREWLSTGRISQLTRRQLVQNSVLALARWQSGSLGLPRAARAFDEINFWATGTLDIGDDGWRTFANDSGVKVEFTDNGNDPRAGRCQAGGCCNANDIYDVAGLQEGSEKELARRGLIAPWDILQMPNYASVWQWAKDIPYLTDRWQGLTEFRPSSMPIPSSP